MKWGSNPRISDELEATGAETSGRRAHGDSGIPSSRSAPDIISTLASFLAKRPERVGGVVQHAGRGDRASLQDDQRYILEQHGEQHEGAVAQQQRHKRNNMILQTPNPPSS